MTDQINETTAMTNNQRVVGSIIGMILGPILFLGSFPLLFWNEGRVDLSLIATTATEISAEAFSADKSLNGKLILATGILNVDASIGDSLFLKPDKFIAIRRKSEMYSWKERKRTETQTESDGSKAIKTIYNYDTEWTEEPMSLDPFRVMKDRDNPKKGIGNFTKTAQNATLGVYDFDVSSIKLPFIGLNLNNQNVQLSQKAKLEGDYIFVSKSGNSSFSNPQVGDLRISYEVVNSGIESTIFGKLDGFRISPYSIGKNSVLYRILPGTREEALTEFHSEYVITLWMFRVVGFLMMFVGMAILFEPISALLNIIPSLGVLKRGLVWAVSFFTTLMLVISLVIILSFLHSIITLIALLIAGLITVFIVMVILGKRQSNSQPPITNE